MESLRVLNPFTSLRVRLGLLVFAAIAGLTTFMAFVFDARLTEAYENAGQEQLRAVANTFADGVEESDLRDPEAYRRALELLADLEVESRGGIGMNSGALSEDTAAVRAVIAAAR